MFKKLYQWTIKPLFTGFAEYSKTEIQDKFIQEKIGALFSDPKRWKENLGTSVVQMFDNEDIAYENWENTARMTSPGQEISIRALHDHLFRRSLQDNKQFTNTSVTTENQRERVGTDFMTNQPIYSNVRMNFEELAEKLVDEFHRHDLSLEPVERFYMSPVSMSSVSALNLSLGSGNIYARLRSKDTR